MSIEARTKAPPRFMVDRHASPVAATPPVVTSLPVRLLFAVFIIFNFPAFTIQLAMDMTTGRWVGSPTLQAVTICSELFASAVILSSRSNIRLVFRCWPIWVLVSLAFASAAWSRNPAASIHASNTYMTSALLGLAMVGALPQFNCIRFSIRAMSLGCLLSLLWVLIFPEIGMHQVTDAYQTVHAGLWGGIFSHKQGLGYFAGLTTGLLLFYRTLIFPLPILIVSLACSVACLIGTQSATGAVTAVLMPTFLHIGYFVTRFPLTVRKALFLQFALVFAAIGIGFKLGILNFVIVQILGKSTDLTGRADFWPIILESFYNSGSSLLGGGFGANIAADMSEWSVDNGYIDKFLEFGYLSSPIIFISYFAILWLAIKLVLTTPSAAASENIFPFAISSTILIVNITESNFMTKSLSTVLTSIAIGLIIQWRTSSTPPTRTQVGGSAVAQIGPRATSGRPKIGAKFRMRETLSINVGFVRSGNKWPRS
jgi:exopolysaccharide production protein ExoQ